MTCNQGQRTHVFERSSVLFNTPCSADCNYGIYEQNFIETEKQRYLKHKKAYDAILQAISESFKQEALANAETPNVCVFPSYEEIVKNMPTNTVRSRSQLRDMIVQRFQNDNKPWRGLSVVHFLPHVIGLGSKDIIFLQEYVRRHHSLSLQWHFFQMIFQHSQWTVTHSDGSASWSWSGVVCFYWSSGLH